VGSFASNYYCFVCNYSLVFYCRVLENKLEMGEKVFLIKALSFLSRSAILLSEIGIPTKT